MRRYIEYDVKSNDNPETQHVVRPIGDEIVFPESMIYTAPRGAVSYRTFVRQESTAPDGEVMVGQRRLVSQTLRLPSLADLTGDIFGAKNKKICDYKNIDLIKGEYFLTRIREAEELERRRMESNEAVIKRQEDLEWRRRGI